MRVSDNGRYLLDNNGNPFFYLADTAWRLFYELSREETDEYLKNRRDKGFTVIMPVILAEVMKGERPCTFYGDYPLIDRDPSRPNENFFRHVDYVVDKANEYGMCMALLPTWGEFVGPLASWGIGPMIFNNENARSYGEYLGKRYRNKNVIWVIGGDRNPDMPEHLEIWRAMAEGLKTGDGGSKLMTYHPMGEFSSSQWLHDEPWLDFNMMQTTPRFHIFNYKMILNDYNKVPVKPVVDGETRYENSHEHFYKHPPTGRRVTAHEVRKAAYNALLCGALGHTYGCRDVWTFYVPSDKPPIREVSMNWKKAIDLPGAFNMGLLKKLMLKFPWHRLIPDQQGKMLVHGCEEGDTFVPAAISEDRKFGLAYVPENQPVYIDMSIFDGNCIKAAWYNPRNGTFLPCGSFKKDETFVGFRPPEDDIDPDYVLVLDCRANS